MNLALGQLRLTQFSYSTEFFGTSSHPFWHKIFLWGFTVSTFSSSLKTSCSPSSHVTLTLGQLRITQRTFSSHGKPLQPRKQPCVSGSFGFGSITSLLFSKIFSFISLCLFNSFGTSFLSEHPIFSIAKNVAIIKYFIFVQSPFSIKLEKKCLF